MKFGRIVLQICAHLPNNNTIFQLWSFHYRLCIVTQAAIPKNAGPRPPKNALPPDNKKAELPQIWPRDAPYIWVPWKFSRVPEYAHGYFCRNFSWAFVPIDHVRTEFEVRSFTRSWDNRGYTKNWAVPGYAHAPFSPKILKGFCSDGPCEYTCQIWSS